MKILFMLIIALSLDACSLEKIIHKNIDKEIDPEIKSIRGWIRVFSRAERLKLFGVEMNDSKREYVISQLIKCLNENSVGRM